MRKIAFFLCSCAVIASTTALAADTPAASPSPSPAPAAPAGQPAQKAAHATMGVEAAPNADPISGTVLETMESGGYSYVYLQKKGGEKVWVATTLTAPVKVGEQASFKPGTEMKGFESKTLKRTFDSILFSEGQILAAGAEKGGHGKQKASPGSSGTTSSKEKISVEKASGDGAVTVAEAFSKSAKLNKKKVAVRGKVVKVSSGIMGKNWIHLQDGTGSSSKSTHNLVCTSKESAAVGDVVTVRGTLAKDRDFGSGYKYKVIIEDARIEK